MRKRQWKKILSLVLAMAMVFTMNTSVFAAANTEVSAPSAESTAQPEDTTAGAAEEPSQTPAAQEPASEPTEEAAQEAETTETPAAAEETAAPAAAEEAASAAEPVEENKDAEAVAGDTGLTDGWSTAATENTDYTFDGEAKKLTLINDITLTGVPADVKGPITVVIPVKKTITLTNAVLLNTAGKALLGMNGTYTNDGKNEITVKAYAYNSTGIDASNYLQDITDSADAANPPTPLLGDQKRAFNKTDGTEMMTGSNPLVAGTTYIGLDNVSANDFTAWEIANVSSITAAEATLSENLTDINMNVTAPTGSTIEYYVIDKIITISREVGKTGILEEQEGSGEFKGFYTAEEGHTYHIYYRIAKTDTAYSSDWKEGSDGGVVIGKIPEAVNTTVVKKIGKTVATISNNGYTNSVYYLVSENKSESYAPSKPKTADPATENLGGSEKWAIFGTGEASLTDTDLDEGKTYKVWAVSQNGSGAGVKYSEPVNIATFSTVSGYEYTITSANKAAKATVTLMDKTTQLDDLFEVNVVAVMGDGTRRAVSSDNSGADEPDGLVGCYKVNELKAKLREGEAVSIIGKTATNAGFGNNEGDYVISSKVIVEEAEITNKGGNPILAVKKTPLTVSAITAVAENKRVKKITFNLYDTVNKKLLGTEYEILSTNTAAYNSFKVDGANIVSTNAYSAGTHTIQASDTASANIAKLSAVETFLKGEDRKGYELIDGTNPAASFEIDADKDDKLALTIEVQADGIQYGENIINDVDAKTDAIAKKRFAPTFTINGTENKEYNSLVYYFTTSADAVEGISDNSAASSTSFNKAIAGGNYSKNLWEYNAGDKVYVIAKAVYGTNGLEAFGKTSFVVKPRDITLKATTDKFTFKRNATVSANDLSSNTIAEITAEPLDGANYSNFALDLETITNLLSENTGYRVNDKIVDYTEPGNYSPSIYDYVFKTKAIGDNFNVTSATLNSLVVTANYYATFIISDGGKTSMSSCEINQNTKKVESAALISWAVSGNGFVKAPKKLVNWSAKSDNNEESYSAATVDALYFSSGYDYTVYAVLQAPTTENGDITVTSIVPVIYDGRQHVVDGSIKYVNEKKWYNDRKSKIDDLSFTVYDSSKGRNLTLGTDYTVSYKNGNTNASVYYSADGSIKQMYGDEKRPYVQVKGKGNYKNLDIKVYYDILPNDLYESDGTFPWMLTRPVISGLKDVYVLGKNKTTTKLGYKVSLEANVYGAYGLKNKKINLKAAKANTKSATGYTGDYKELIYKYVSANNGWTLQESGVNGAGDYLLVLEGINNYQGKYTTNFYDFGGYKYCGGVNKVTNVDAPDELSYYNNTYEFKVVDNTGVDISKATLKAKNKTLTWNEKGVSANDFGPTLQYKGKDVKATFVLVNYGTDKVTDAGTYTLRAIAAEKGYYGSKDLKVTVKGLKLNKSAFKQLYSEDGGKTWKNFAKSVDFRNDGYYFTVSSASLSANSEYWVNKTYCLYPDTYTVRVYGEGKYAGSTIDYKFKINKTKLSNVIDKTVSISAAPVSLNVAGSYPDIIISANGRTGENATRLTWNGKKGYYEESIWYYVGDTLQEDTNYLTPNKGTFTGTTYDDSYINYGNTSNWHNYTFKITKNTAAGTGTLTITADDYSGSVKKDFTITPLNVTKVKDISEVTAKTVEYGDIVSSVEDVKTNTKGTYKPKFKLYQVGSNYSYKEIKAGNDYDKNVKFNLVSANGANTVSVNTGKKTNFKFAKDTPSDSKWYIYNDTAKKVEIIVSTNAFGVIDESDHNNDEILCYGNDPKKPVKVVQDGTKITTTYCGGQAVMPRVEKITVDGTTYSLSSNAYKVSYSNNTKVGNATITVKLQKPATGTYAFGGTKTFKFKIEPAKGEQVVMEK